MKPRHLAALALAFVLTPAYAQTDSARSTIASLQRLLVERPNEPTLYYYLAAFQARAGDKDEAIASLEKLSSLGTGFLPAPFMGFEALSQDTGYQAVHAKLEAKLPRVADAPIAFEIADRTFIPEGIAWDPESKRFFLGSITQHRIVGVDMRGKVAPFSRPEDGLQHVLGLAVDAKRHLLHAVSTSALTAAGRAPRRNEVVSYDLRTGRRIAAVPVPGAEQLNDVAVAPNGDRYASDSASGAVWRIRGDAVAAFAPTGQVRGSNGLAVSADGAALYIAHTTGVARVDTATGTFERMTIPAGDTVAAIDGLYVYGDSLLGVQNVTNPARIIRMHLSADGKAITRVEVLQSHHHPAFDEPTTGAIVGHDFFVLATTQVARFNDKGELERPESAATPKVIRIALPAPPAATAAN
ncbi:MAG: SMP-30/gluconolactonase/LRE family protein [Steroidobacteraceae bacterium]